MDYDNSGQDTSNFGDTNDSYVSYNDNRQDNYESQNHGSHHDHYSNAKDHESPKTPESKNVEFSLPPPSKDDENSDLIDIQKDHQNDPTESEESTPKLELGNYENSIIDHFDSAFVNLKKDNGSNNETKNVTRNDSNAFSNRNNEFEKENTDCCGCSGNGGGPLVCLAFFCDCFGL